MSDANVCAEGGGTGLYAIDVGSTGVASAVCRCAAGQLLDDLDATGVARLRAALSAAEERATTLQRERDAALARVAELERASADDLRAAGWMVAVHNDYRQDGVPRTFWLLTHSSGRWIKGEAESDADALTAARSALAEGKGDGHG